MIGAILLLVVLFLPETTFNRSESTPAVEFLPAVINNSSHGTKAVKSEKADKLPVESNKASGTAEEIIPLYRRIIGLGTFNVGAQSRVISNLVAPLLLLRSPATIWSCAMWSVVYSWLIISSAVAEQIFSAPPYNMDSIEVGIFFGCAPLVGAVLGSLSSGVMLDFIAKHMSARNNGIYEPEFRLLIMVPFTFIWCAGIFGLGAALEQESSKVVCGALLGKFSRPNLQYVIFELRSNLLAITAFAVGVGCTGIVSYSNDVCRDRAAESFGVTMVSCISPIWFKTSTNGNF